MIPNWGGNSLRTRCAIWFKHRSFKKADLYSCLLFSFQLSSITERMVNSIDTDVGTFLWEIEQSVQVNIKAQLMWKVLWKVHVIFFCRSIHLKWFWLFRLLFLFIVACSSKQFALYVGTTEIKCIFFQASRAIIRHFEAATRKISEEEWCQIQSRSAHIYIYTVYLLTKKGSCSSPHTSCLLQALQRENSECPICLTKLSNLRLDLENRENPPRTDSKTEVTTSRSSRRKTVLTSCAHVFHATCLRRSSRFPWERRERAAAVLRHCSALCARSAGRSIRGEHCACENWEKSSCLFQFSSNVFTFSKKNVHVFFNVQMCHTSNAFSNGQNASVDQSTLCERNLLSTYSKYFPAAQWLNHWRESIFRSITRSSRSEWRKRFSAACTTPTWAHEIKQNYLRFRQTALLICSCARCLNCVWDFMLFQGMFAISSCHAVDAAVGLGLSAIVERETKISLWHENISCRL